MDATYLTLLIVLSAAMIGFLRLHHLCVGHRVCVGHRDRSNAG